MSVTLYSRLESQVVIRGNSAVLRRIAELAKPFINETHEVPAQLPDCWRIIVHQAQQMASASTFKLFDISSPSEPDLKVGLATSQRELTLLSGNLSWRSHSALRLLRNIMRLQLAKAGMAFVHAGMVEIAGKGVVLAGASKSGKTTTVVALSKTRGAKLVANDDLSIDIATCRGYGWPRSIGIRSDTLATLGLLDVVSDIARHLPPYMEGRRELNGRVFFYPRCLADALGCELAESSPVAMIVFPTFVGTATSPKLRRLSVSEAMTRAREIVESIPDEGDKLFRDGWEVPESRRNAIASYLAHEVRCYELHQSLGAVLDGARCIAEEVASLS